MTTSMAFGGKGGGLRSGIDICCSRRARSRAEMLSFLQVAVYCCRSSSCFFSTKASSFAREFLAAMNNASKGDARGV